VGKNIGHVHALFGGFSFIYLFIRYYACFYHSTWCVVCITDD